MTRAVICTAVLLTFACSSSNGSNGGGSAGAAPVGQAGSVGQAGAGVGQAGTATGGANSNPGAGAGGAAPAGAGGPSAGGTSNAGAGGAVVGMAGGNATGGSSTAGAAGAAGAPAPGGDSVTQRGGDSARTSHWVHPTLTKANMTKMAFDANFNARFTGEFASSPLYLPGVAGAPGRFYVATTENNVYALDETTGAIVWTRNIGAYLVNAPVCSAAPVHHGILSTGVIDPATRVLYVVGAMADKHHELHALQLDNMGAELPGFPFNFSTVKAGNLTFGPIQDVQNQRSALSLVNGTLYVAFGGYCGDNGNYHGWVVAVDSKDPTKVGAWATMDARQSGIWAAGGLASDGNGVFAITGNAMGVTGTDHSQSDSEEILRITGLAVPHRDNVNLFLPQEWATPMNSTDKDFGSSSPAVITVPNSTPSKIIVAPSKPGRVYFLDAANLGGIRGQFADVVVAGTTDQSVYTAPSAYQATTGVYVAISTGVRSTCPIAGNANVMSILMQPGSPPMPKIAWCAPVATGDTVLRSPISTNSAGSADPIVWMINGDKLNGFDGETGAVLYNSGAGTPSTCAGVAKFTAPIEVNGRIVTGGTLSGMSRLCSWSVH